MLTTGWAWVLGWGLSERWLFTLGTFLVHEVTFVPLNALLFLCHYRGWLSRYKIQKKPLSAAAAGPANSKTLSAPVAAPADDQPAQFHFPKSHLIRECIMALMVSHLVLQIPTLYFIYPAFTYFGLRSDMASLPGMGEVILHLLLFVAINDTGFYWMHRLLHTKWLYRTVHARHHRFTTPVGISSEFAHPVLANQLPTILGAMLLGSHLLTFWIWIALRIVETIEAHSGYSFPFSPFVALPFINGADAHDFHHSHNVDNYGSFSVFWDWMMGTNQNYKRWQEKQKKAS